MLLSLAFSRRCYHVVLLYCFLRVVVLVVLAVAIVASGVQSSPSSSLSSSFVIRHPLVTILLFLLLSRCIVVLCCFVLFRIVVLVVLFHLTFNLLSTTPIFWLVIKIWPHLDATTGEYCCVRVGRNENDVPLWSTAQEEKKGRGYEHKYILLINRSRSIFLFVLAALFVLTTLCVTVDGMRVSAHPDL